jgi:hypothetical protein
MEWKRGNACGDGAYRLDIHGYG